MQQLCKRFLREENGATAIEYGLICALVVSVVVASMMMVSGRTTAMYNLIINTWDSAVP